MTVNAETLKRNILALSKVSPDDLKDKKKHRTFLEHVGKGLLEFLGIDADESKVGRKVSKARLEKLRALQNKVKELGSELEAFITEAAADGAGFLDTLTDKGVAEMKPEEIKAAVIEATQEALKPVQADVKALTTRVETVEKGLKGDGDGKGDDKKGDDKKPDATVVEAIKSAVSGAVEEGLKPIKADLDGLKTRVEGVEALAKGSRQNKDGGGDDTADKGKGGKDKDPFGTAVRERREPLVSGVRGTVARAQK